MIKKTVLLDRNKIVEIGKHIPYTKIEQRDNKSNKLIYSYQVYKTSRRKNILYCYAFSAKLKLVFNTINYAKKYQKIIKGKMK